MLTLHGAFCPSKRGRFMSKVPRSAKVATPRNYKKKTYCNKRLCYEVMIHKTENHFIVGGFSRYKFNTTGECFSIVTGEKLAMSDASEGKYILTDDTQNRTTLRINNIVNFVLDWQ